MATLNKQTINIGNQSNDGTGDSIRDAFSKSNNNFDILFNAAGLGSGLRFTNLIDAPSTLNPQRVLVTDQAGLTVTQLSLVGGTGINLAYDYNSGLLTISNTASALYTDPNPYLSADLSGSGFRATNFGDPERDQDLITRSWLYKNFLNRDAEYVYDVGSPASNATIAEGSTLRHNVQLLVTATNTVTNVGKYITVYSSTGTTSTVNLEYQPNLASHITKKQYVDTKISLQGMETVDPETGEINPGWGMMTGPLMLSRDPTDLDSPLMAATRNYVDNNGYYSTNNLYVTMKGRDYQPDIPAYKRGRFYQYAFATVNKAAVYAEQLIATSRIEVGDYARLITYNNGTACTVNTVTDNYNGTGLTRLVLNAGSLGSDQFGVAPSGKFTIFPGQYVQGVDSGAIGLIENIASTGGNPGQEIYTVAYVDYAINFFNDITASIPDAGNPNQVLFTLRETEIVPIPDFWVGYQFYDSDLDLSGTILEIDSTADVNGNYTGKFLVDFGTSTYSDGDQLVDGRWHIYSGDFTPGETILYNTNVSSLQITINIESGEYFEQLPIKLSANCSIKGDEFRRVIIRPADGISTSSWAKTYFRRDTQIDGLQTTEINTLTNYATQGSLAGVEVTPNGSTGLVAFTLSSSTISSSYVGYVFVGNDGQGVITETNSTTFVVNFATDMSGVSSIAAGAWKLYKPINFGYHYLTDPTNVASTPKLNSEMDVFLMNDASIIRYISCQNHGGFMCVLDPVGQIKNKSPYIQTASSFSQSIAKHAFRGGMFADGFSGNIEVTPTTPSLSNPLAIPVSGLVRRPQVPTFFSYNGIRYEVDFFSNFAVNPSNTSTYTATLNLNPLTPGGIPNTVSTTDSTGGFKPLQLRMPITVSSPSGVGGIVATGHAVIDGGGFVNSIAIDFPGTGYTGTPTIVIGDAVLNNLQISNGHITNATIAYGGSGFAVGCAIKFVPQNATSVYTATATVSSVDLNGGITGITIVSSGTNWASDVNYLVTYGGANITVPAPRAGFIDTVPSKLELITAGNRSMLANDFTQVNDLGYGIFITNGGFAENVSMFTYYCYRSYYSLNGSQIRSVGGSSGYGEYGLCAEGSDPNEVPISVKLAYPLSQVATAYVSEPFFPASTGATTIFVQVDPANGGFPALGSSQIEINHQGIIKNYSIGSAVQALDANNEVIPNVYQLSFNSGNIGSTGLFAALSNGDPVTCRAQGLNKFYGINPDSLSRPSTALTMNDDPTTVYHVTGYSSIQSDNAVFISTLENYNYVALSIIEQGLTYPKIIDHGGGYTTATMVINTASIKTNINRSVNGDQGSTGSGVQSLLLDDVADVIVGQYVDGAPITTGTTVTYVNSSTNIIGISLPTSGIVANNSVLSFTGVIPSAHAIITTGTGYIDSIIIDNPGIGWSTTNTAISVTGNVGSIQLQTPINIAGVPGSRTIKINPLDSSGEGRITAGLSNNPVTYYQFGYNGQLFNITAYRGTDVTGQTWAEIDVDKPLATAAQKGITLYAGAQGNNPGKITTKLSLLRVTSHDLVDIGTGGYADTRIPNDLYGPPINKPQQIKEVVQIGKARVYYATTDQDGNFRVGTAFTVNQALGSVSINAPIDLSNLSTISLKRDLGPAINEFSTDNTMAAEADYKVPTEQAVVNYINRRLGLTRSGVIYAGSALGPQFMALSGVLSMKGALNMGSHNITNLSTPRTGVGTDAANKSFVEQRIEIRGTSAYDTNGTTPMPQYGVMTGPLQLVGDPAVSTTSTTVDVNTGSYSLYLADVYGSQLKSQVNVAGVPEGTIVTGLDFSGNRLLLSNSTTDVISSGTVVQLDPIYQAATKGYVDTWLITNNNTATITNTASSSGGGSDVTIAEGFGLVTIKLAGGLGANNPITDYNISTDASIDVNKLSTSTISGVQLGNDLPTLTFGTGTFGVSYNGVSSSTIYIGQDVSTTSNVTFSGITITNMYADPVNTTTVYGTWTLAVGASFQSTYADLAEWYSADTEYDPGTVLVFGGNAEVTTTNEVNDSRVAGVVTTNPAYVLNQEQQGIRACIALQGRVPVKVFGVVQKGDLLTTSNIPEYACKATNPQVGTIIGKALENKNTLGRGIIEVAIGRN
jgi:hypothetical protein